MVLGMAFSTGGKEFSMRSGGRTRNLLKIGAKRAKGLFGHSPIWISPYDYCETRETSAVAKEEQLPRHCNNMLPQCCT